MELDDWADRFGVGTYDLAIYSEVIEHLAADPAKSLHEINRLLKLGGYLILTTVNIGSELGIYSLANGEAPYAMGNILVCTAIGTNASTPQASCSGLSVLTVSVAG